MTTILLARHGQASFGQENYDQLSELGGKQARLLGQHYARTNRQIDAVFSGSLVRQKDSAQHFLTAYQPSVGTDKPIMGPSAHDNFIIEAFNEFNHKDVFIKSNPAFSSPAAIATELAKSGKPKERLGELFHLAMQRWHAGDNDEDYIESWSQFNIRAQSALQELQHRVTQLNLSQDYSSKNYPSKTDRTVLVFTSGGVIAALTANLLQQGSQTAYQINRSLINTGVTAITLSGQKPSDQVPHLLSLNEYSHLYADGKRFVTWR